MRNAISIGSLFILTAGLLMGCQTTPSNDAKKDQLHDEVQNTLRTYTAQDESFKQFLDKAQGYVVFPSVGKGGLIVGGSYGRAEVYEGGQMIGWADISQATVGLQAGGQTFSEVICFETPQSMANFKQNKLSFAANASAVALKSGAGATTRYSNGVAVFTRPIGGLMFEAAIGGQQFTYSPKH